jgi:hypothetical protein
VNDTGGLFRVVLRGYDPAQVEHRVEELTVALQEAARQRDDLTSRLQNTEEELTRAIAAAAPAPATYDHLGERVAQILSLAEAEAAELRQSTADEIAAKQRALMEEADKIRAEAEHYAAGRRRDAETEAARLLEDARRQADEVLDAAGRDAAARMQEAEALHEEQRARAAKAATAFETTLSARRAVAEEEFTTRMADTSAQLEEAAANAERARLGAEALLADAGREARRILEEADTHATALVAEAKAVAAKVRADSERELAAATQRRDSINAQLANVRQMLATLTGVPITPTPADPLDPLSAPALPLLADVPEQVDGSHDSAQLAD